MNRQKRKYAYCGTIILFLIVIFSVAFLIQNCNEKKYRQADIYYKNGEYLKAEEIYLHLGNYRDSENLKEQMAFLAGQSEKYNIANSLLAEGAYAEAIQKFNEIEDYEDSINKIITAKYELAKFYYEQCDYESAKKIFIELDDYLNSKFYLAQIEVKLIAQYQEIIYQEAFLCYEDEKFAEAIELFKAISNYKDSDELQKKCTIQLKRRSHNNILAAGIRNSATITNTNRVNIVGNSKHGQQKVNEWENIISIDIYGNLTIGLQEDNIAKIAGTFDGNNTINPEKWYDLVDIAAGEQFVVGLKSDGFVIADGHPSDGQLEVDKWENVIAIDAGSRFTVGLTNTGELLFAGFDNGQAKDFENHKDEWKDVINIAASGSEKGGVGGGHTVGLKSDGTLVAVGDNSYGQCDFSDTEKWSDIVKIATGDWYTVGLKSTGEVVITGENAPGRKYIDKEILSKYTNIVDIAAGYGQTLLLTDEGEIICFGFNDDGKCSDINGYKDVMLPQY